MGAVKRRLTTVLSVVGLLLLTFLILAIYTTQVHLYTVEFYDDTGKITSITKKTGQSINDNDLIIINNYLKKQDQSYTYTWTQEKDKYQDIKVTDISVNTTLYLFKELIFTPIEIVTIDTTKVDDYKVDYVYPHIPGEEPYCLVTVEPKVDQEEFQTVLIVNGKEIYGDSNNNFKIQYTDVPQKVEVVFKEIVKLTLEETTCKYGEEIIIPYKVNKENININQNDFTYTYYQDSLCSIAIEPDQIGSYYVKVHYNGSEYAIDDQVTILNIEKGIPVIEVKPSASIGYEGNNLFKQSLIAGKANIEGSFKWLTDISYMEKGINKVKVLFTPTDTRYEELVFEIEVNILSNEEILNTIKNTRESIFKEYRNILENKVTEIPDLLIEDTSHSEITWLADSTAININKDGTNNLTEQYGEYDITLTGIITLGNCADYVQFKFILVVEEADEVIVNKQVIKPRMKKTIEKESVQSTLSMIKSTPLALHQEINLVFELPNRFRQIGLDNIIQIANQKHQFIYQAVCQKTSHISEIILWKIISNEDKDKIMNSIKQIKINLISSKGEK